MRKKILNPVQSRQVAAKAIQEIAGAVKQTLGPGGNPIIIQREGQNPDGTPLAPLVTKDGVTVAEHVKFRDPAMNTIAQTIIQVAQNTVKEGGDGTTTSVVLAEAIYLEGLKHLEQGVNSIQLYNALRDKASTIIEFVNEIKQTVDEQDVYHIARISANGDDEVAEVVQSAITAVGEDGYVSLEDGSSRDTSLEVVEGSYYKTGWKHFSPLGYNMVTNEAKNACEIDTPAILLYAGKLDNIQEFDKFLARIWKYSEQHRSYTDIIPMMIVANDYSDDVKEAILKMRKSGKMPIGAIKSPADGSPNSRTEMLEDMAAMFGAKVAAKGLLELADVEDEHLGCAERVEIRADEAAFFKGHGDKEVIMKRIKDINYRLENERLHDFDAENLRFRKGKLSGGIAVIRVGGYTELEMLERKDRIEDALCASRVAIRDGIIPGGGSVLYDGSFLFAEDSSVAGKIMFQALQAPFKQIVANAGFDPREIIAKSEYSEDAIGTIFDASTGSFVDRRDSGIIDPAHVTKSALENAVSIAGLLLTTGGALVADKESADGTPNPLAGLMG